MSNMAGTEETQFMRPNIFLRLGGTDVSQVEMTAFWEPVIVWLADKFPKWRFVGAYLTQTEASRKAGDKADWKWYPRRWAVYLDGEELGCIGQDYYGHKRCYTISNDRICEKRERGHASKTTKIEKAKKIIMKNFRPKDLKELIREGYREMRGEINSQAYASSHDAHRKYTRLCAFLMDDILENTDTYVQLAVRRGYQGDEAKDLQESYAVSKVHGSISKCVEENKGAAVLIHGDTYAVQTNGEDQLSIYESATLPDSLKRKLGLLKLLDKGNFLIDVGYRGDDNLFYVNMEDKNGRN